MSEKNNSYQKVGNFETSNGADTEKNNGNWRWVANEKEIIVAITVLTWSYLFIEFSFMNQTLANEIKGLSDGFFGFKRDTHDFQWNSFRQNLHIIIAVACGHLIGSHLIKKYIVKSRTDDGPNKVLLVFHLVLGIANLVYMFEAGIIFWFCIVIFNYVWAKYFGSYSFYEPCLWILTVATLYCNETYHGYKFVWFHPSLEFLDESMRRSPVGWHILFNLTILRQMSFCLDFSWAIRQKRDVIFLEHKKKCKICNYEIRCYKFRQEAHSPLPYYNFLNYLSYLVYPALFLSGPVTTFNAWISQIKTPQNTHSQTEVLKYVLRTALNFIGFELFLHLFYVCAISTHSENIHIWQKFSLHHLGVLSFLELTFLWFKFLMIWRIARAWAFLDGVEVPENMNRCICNNYSFEGFWRSWHRSFNQWLIRYLFIPLGGSRYKFFNIWVVFSFVAIWHDMNLNLVIWAWGICLALMPEMLLKWYFNLPKYRYLWNKVWWKYACALAGGVDILLMISANLVGFGIGWKILLVVLDNFMNFNGFLTLTIGYGIFSVLTLVMFMIREKENDAEKGF